MQFESWAKLNMHENITHLFDLAQDSIWIMTPHSPALFCVSFEVLWDRQKPTLRATTNGHVCLGDSLRPAFCLLWSKLLEAHQSNLMRNRVCVARSRLYLLRSEIGMRRIRHFGSVLPTSMQSLSVVGRRMRRLRFMNMVESDAIFADWCQIAFWFCLSQLSLQVDNKALKWHLTYSTLLPSCCLCC